MKYTFVASRYREETCFLGSVYTSVTRSLLKRPHWRRKRSSALTPTVDLFLGEALGKGIPHTRLHWLPPRHRPVLVNFFRNYSVICRKEQQIATLRRYAEDNDIDVGTLCPTTFIFWPSDHARSRPEMEAFLDAHEQRLAEGESVWILKPGDGGKGQKILVERDVDAILAHLEMLPPSSPPWVLQRYLERPLLLPGGRKFDVRVWVLVTHDLRVLVHRQGVLRTGCVPFSLDDLGDAYTHLSNHCIQANHPAFGAYEPTNEMFFAEFDAWLRTLPGAPTLDGTVAPQFASLIAHAMRAAAPALRASQGRNHRAFQLFGFDFMVDAALRVHLIEVNSSPAVAAQLLPAVTEDLIAAAIDPAFPPPATPPVLRDRNEGGPGWDARPAPRGSPAKRVAAAIGELLSPHRRRRPSARHGDRGGAAEGEFFDLFGGDVSPAAESGAVDAAAAAPAAPPAAGAPEPQSWEPLDATAPPPLTAQRKHAIAEIWLGGDSTEALPPDWASRPWNFEIMARRGFEEVADLSSPPS